MSLVSMTKSFSAILLLAACLFLPFSFFAQDSTKPGAIKNITRSNTRADELNGKKIQRQTLSNNHVQRLGTTAVKKPRKKHRVRKKNMHAVLQQ